MDWYDWVRVVNASLAVATMYQLGRSWLRRSDSYSPRLRDFWWSLNALLFCSLLGSIENILRDRPATSTLFVLAFASLITYKASTNKDETLLIDK